ncbi:MAG: type II toxin-antitoxin system VapC family toxin [Acidithiobacillus sp.]
MTAQRLLLDTNVLLASLLAPERLPKATQKSLTEPRNTVLFSAASIWEIAIKRGLHRADFDFEPEHVVQLARETGFTELPLEGVHTYALASLPWHHKDPFDRILIAQAITLPARLLTTDTALTPYSSLVDCIPWES